MVRRFNEHRTARCGPFQRNLGRPRWPGPLHDFPASGSDRPTDPRGRGVQRTRLGAARNLAGDSAVYLYVRARSHYYCQLVNPIGPIRNVGLLAEYDSRLTGTGVATRARRIGGNFNRSIGVYQRPGTRVAGSWRVVGPASTQGSVCPGRNCAASLLSHRRCAPFLPSRPGHAIENRRAGCQGGNAPHFARRPSGRPGLRNSLNTDCQCGRTLTAFFSHRRPGCALHSPITHFIRSSGPWRRALAATIVPFARKPFAPTNA